ncbi:MAG TPA: type II toxin-antitoxin system RnlB family antitoxin [Stenomitos sp.]
MNNDYTIQLLRNSRYSCIVFCNNYYSPIDYFNDLDKDLCELKLKGYIVFDLLLVNGMSNNRFAECYYDGKRLDINNLRVVAVDNYIVNKSRKYFMSQNDYIENSTLTRAAKFRFKKKLAA